MKYNVAIALGDTITAVVKLENVQKVMVNQGVYNIQETGGKVLFTSPLEKVAYIQKVDS